MIKTVTALVLLGMMATSAAERRIEHVRDNVYRFIDNRHRAVFMVTDEGIVVTDPMNGEAARWLETELSKRFEQSVRYVIYSHNHRDHVYGADAFEKPGVDFVSHRLAREDLVATKAQTVIPNQTFDERMILHLGEDTVELTYHGSNDGYGSISMLFEPAGVMFVVDWIVLGRMPWRKLESYDIQGLIDSTREVLERDFEVLVGGHAEVGDKTQVRRYLDYLLALRAAVVDGIVAGHSLERMKTEIRLDTFSDFANYEEWLPLNIEGVHEQLIERSGMGWRPE